MTPRYTMTSSAELNFRFGSIGNVIYTFAVILIPISVFMDVVQMLTVHVRSTTLTLRRQPVGNSMSTSSLLPLYSYRQRCFAHVVSDQRRHNRRLYSEQCAFPINCV